ncbi:hypothetical protein [Microbacterium arborescens]|uniref:hypothetical protein n=1 Tax=Microbacterium arborescens TaxID=33883 RepID=UPI000DF7A4B3|nr:hypothetical protein [Microbacterium arborescens]
MSDHSYERVTQLLPAAAVISPLSVLVLLVFRADDAMALTRSVVGVAGAAGFHLLVMRLIRDRGNRVQRKLWESWGGSLTTQSLRWSRRDEASVRRLHRRIQQRTGVKLPSLRFEETHPGAADQKYAEAVKALQELTRDHAKHPRVWSELKQYGTARNFYGAKTAGLAVAGVVASASALLGWLSHTGGWDVHWGFFAVACTFAVLVVVMWLTVVTPEFVRVAAQRYSDALISSIWG